MCDGEATFTDVSGQGSVSMARIEARAQVQVDVMLQGGALYAMHCRGVSRGDGPEACSDVGSAVRRVCDSHAVD